MSTDLESRSSLESRMGNMEGHMGNMEGRMGSMEGRMSNLEGQVFQLTQAVQDLRAGQRQILLAIVGLGSVILAAQGGVIGTLIALALRQGG